MTPSKYEELAMRTQASQMKIINRLADMTTEQLIQLTQLRNGTTGLSDEVGEINSCVKKHVEYGQPLNVDNLKEEIGDCLWRLSQISQAIGYSLEQAMIHNIQKLKVRYPDGFSDFNAAEENRDREAEQIVHRPGDGSPSPYMQSAGDNVQRGHGFAEPPFEFETASILDIPAAFIPEAEPIVPVSFGDGLVRGKTLDNSYDRFCKVCHRVPVHHTNEACTCPNCAADIRAGRIQ